MAADGPGGSRPRVIITHDFMETLGGAERVTQEMAIAFPEAPVYAILGRRSVAEMMGVRERFHSLLAPRPRLLRHYRLLTPLYPALVDRTTLPDADVVLSSSYAFAHRFDTAAGARRVCYCHSPLRFAWTMTERYRSFWAGGPLAGAAFDALAARMRASDRASAQGVDLYLTQSEHVAGMIHDAYGLEAEVIGAPIDCDLFHPGGEPEDYYLLVGRLIEPYMGAAPVLEAFRQMPGERLLVAGTGPAAEELRALAPPNVEFLGRVSDDELVRLMQRCRAFISPTLHDFGLINLEVQACGRPVLAYGKGGALITVVPGLGGEHFPAQTADAVRDAVQAFDPGRYDPAAIRRHAERWDRKAWRAQLVDAVDRVWRAASA